MSLAQKIVQIRKMKGFSQEELSDKAGISLRTLQRIEKGETEPRGHTLRALTEVLEVPIEELMDFTKKEDKPFLLVMGLSQLAYWFMPLLNIVVPLVFWLFRRDKIKGVDRVGRQIISFQIIWTILTYGVPIGVLLFGSFNAHSWIGNPLLYFFSLYGVNVLIILISVIRLKMGKDWIYFLPLKFI